MTEKLNIRLTEEVFPPYHDLHGTNSEMVRRTLEFQLQRGSSIWEQTDYGHPGRFNPWDQRKTDTALQPRAEELRSIAEVLGKLAAED